MGARVVTFIFLNDIVTKKSRHECKGEGSLVFWRNTSQQVQVLADVYLYNVFYFFNSINTNMNERQYLFFIPPPPRLQPHLCILAIRNPWLGKMSSHLECVIISFDRQVYGHFPLSPRNLYDSYTYHGLRPRCSCWVKELVTGVIMLKKPVRTSDGVYWNVGSSI